MTHFITTINSSLLMLQFFFDAHTGENRSNPLWPSKNQTRIALIIYPIHNSEITEINVSEIREVDLKEKMLTATFLKNLFHHMPYFQCICDFKGFNKNIKPMLDLPIVKIEYNSNLVKKAVSKIELILNELNTKRLLIKSGT